MSAVITAFGGSHETVVYIVAILIGAASSITMVTALSVTAELIGPRTENSALVYSIVTFLDKIVTGIVVILIEKWQVTSVVYHLTVLNVMNSKFGFDSPEFQEFCQHCDVSVLFIHPHFLIVQIILDLRNLIAGCW